MWIFMSSKIYRPSGDFIRKLQILIDFGRNGRVKWAVEIKWIFLTSQNTQMVEFKWTVDLSEFLL